MYVSLYSNHQTSIFTLYMIKWLKRIGVAGFLFFLIKGLIWVGIFFYIKSCSDKKKEKAGIIIPASTASTFCTLRVSL